jgi:hypothetical protein
MPWWQDAVQVVQVVQALKSVKMVSGPKLKRT